MKMNNVDTKDKLEKRRERERQSLLCSNLWLKLFFRFSYFISDKIFLNMKKSSEFLKLIYAINLAKTVCLISSITGLDVSRILVNGSHNLERLP